VTPIEIAPEGHENKRRGESGRKWEEEALGGWMVWRENTDIKLPRAAAAKSGVKVTVAGCIWLVASKRATSVTREAVQGFVARGTSADGNRTFVCH
jgi:hypothetical protein